MIFLIILIITRKYFPALLLLYNITLCTLKFNINEWVFVFSFHVGSLIEFNSSREVLKKGFERGAENVIPSLIRRSQKGLIPAILFPSLTGTVAMVTPETNMKQSSR